VKIVRLQRDRPVAAITRRTPCANLGYHGRPRDKNIVSEETDVTQVVAQIAAGQGASVSSTSTRVWQRKGKVKAILLPAGSEGRKRWTT